MKSVDIHVLDTPVCKLGEAPFWDQGMSRLNWVDIESSRLFCLDDSGEVDTWQVAASSLSAAFPVPNGWLLVMEHGFGYLSSAQDLMTLAQPEARWGPRLRMNDAACDPAGRLWAGSTSTTGKEQIGSLFRMDLDGSVSRLMGDLTVANGMGWSPEGDFFYLIDSVPGLLWSWRFDVDQGILTERHLLSDALGPGIPDGLAIDTDGCLWIAFYGSGRIRRFSASGKLLAEVHLPLRFPTSVCFGDDTLDTLYVTSAQGPNHEPIAGHLLALDPGATGLPTRSYGGKQAPTVPTKTKAGK